MEFASKNTDMNLPMPESLETQSIDNIKENEVNTLGYGETDPECDQFIEISSPDQFCYLESTYKIDISEIEDFTELSYVTDGIQTVTFDTSVEKRQVPDSWRTWSNPPQSESPQPAVLFAETQSLTLTLSKPSKVFGIELEPDAFGSFESIVEFYSGVELIGIINRSVDGNGGARLFAAAYSTLPFDRIVVKVAAGSIGFAIAQLRYGEGIECNLYCTERCIPFECRIDVEAQILRLGEPHLVDYVLKTSCEPGRCYTRPIITACDETMQTSLPCEPVNISYIRGVAGLDLCIEALVRLSDLEPEYAKFNCTAQIDICQNCFSFDIENQQCTFGELALDTIYAYINEYCQIVIKGAVKYICPPLDN